MKVGGCCIFQLTVVVWSFLGTRPLGMGILGTGFLLRVVLHGLELSLVGPGWTEVERRTEGGSTETRVGGCCILKMTVAVWSFLGPDYRDGDFGDGVFFTERCFARTSIEPGGPKLVGFYDGIGWARCWWVVLRGGW